ncbi:BglG family transcription antiterminator [Anaerosolibacter sp.]|uniref:BglG family transcription antiterminator n=1 Tax=Anaerosolibacter sp. TaxID=1872527 RepID=UPI0039EFFCB5
MSELLLTARGKQILKMMGDASKPITIGDIARNLDVSPRTILREMPIVEQWLEKSDFKLMKKTKVGVQLIATLEERRRLITMLDAESVELEFTPENRQSLIISELLQNNEPTKLYYFSSLFKVSEGTISHDLDKVEVWLNKHELTLIRKPGLGVYIEGNENSFRRAMITILYENLDEDQLLEITRQNLTGMGRKPESIEISTSNRLMNMIDKDVIKTIEEIIGGAEANLEYKLTDSAYVGLIVHLALAIQRIKNNERIVMKEEFFKELVRSREYKIAEKIAAEITQSAGIEIPRDEIGYITMHLKGAKMRNGIYDHNDFKDTGEFIIGNFELTQLANQMIKVAEKEAGYILKDNENLLFGLISHLRPAVNRLKMNLDIRNPLLGKIKQMYPEIFKISEKCAEVVNKRFDVVMPEAEIGYIAMHFGAAIEKKRQASHRQRVYRVIVACTSGIGTSRLLATRLRKEFQNIDIVDIVSTIHIDEEWLKDNKIDLIITTVYMEGHNVPVIQVDPLLIEENKKKLQNILEHLNVHLDHELPAIAHSNMDLKERSYAMKEYGEGVIEILEGFFFKEELEVEDMEQLIRQASHIIADNEGDAAMIEQDLLERERKGSTVLNKKEMMLLHCRTRAMDRLRVGVLRLKDEKPVYCLNGNHEQEQVRTCLVMITPINKSKRHLEVISQISRSLIDEPVLTDVLSNGSQEEVFNELNKILSKFLNEKTNMI